MLIENGQSPTPKICPCSVLLRLNSRPQSVIIWERTTKPNAAVAISAMKQAQKSSFSSRPTFSVEGTSLVKSSIGAGPSHPNAW